MDTIPQEIVGENMELKRTNKMYRNIFIGIILLAVAIVAYWLGTLRTATPVEKKTQLDSIDETYIPSTPTNSDVPLNSIPSDSNPQGSDTAPPGGVILD